MKNWKLISIIDVWLKEVKHSYSRKKKKNQWKENYLSPNHDMPCFAFTEKRGHWYWQGFCTIAKGSELSRCEWRPYLLTTLSKVLHHTALLSLSPAQDHILSLGYLRKLLEGTLKLHPGKSVVNCSVSGAVIMLFAIQLQCQLLGIKKRLRKVWCCLQEAKGETSLITLLFLTESALPHLLNSANVF